MVALYVVLAVALVVAAASVRILKQCERGIVFPAPFMSTLGELGTFLSRETQAATPTPTASGARGNGDLTAAS